MDKMAAMELTAEWQAAAAAYAGLGPLAAGQDGGSTVAASAGSDGHGAPLGEGRWATTLGAAGGGGVCCVQCTAYGAQLGHWCIITTAAYRTVPPWQRCASEAKALPVTGADAATLRSTPFTGVTCSDCQQSPALQDDQRGEAIACGGFRHAPSCSRPGPCPAAPLTAAHCPSPCASSMPRP